MLNLFVFLKTVFKLLNEKGLGKNVKVVDVKKNAHIF